MSCGHLCQCQLSWPLDTSGFKRDPINSEKAWLDFAVRLLSREVVGKGKGQETVWSVKCKPVWWDSAVGLAWKNPTTNPKDNKEVLQLKYSALEKCLRDEGRFPKELEEEAKLWSEGKVNELYLQTTLTCLLGKVTSLHCAVDHACKQVKEMNAKVDISLVSDITTCLNATLRATENFQGSNPATIKRPQNRNGGKENCISGPSKCRKVEPIATLPSKVSHINSQVQDAVPQKPTSDNQILAKAQTQMDKRKRMKSQTVKNLKRIFPKTQSLPCSNVSIISPVEIPVSKISGQQLNYIIQTNVILSSSLQLPSSSLNVPEAHVNSTCDFDPGNLNFLHWSDLASENSEAGLITQPTNSIPSVLPSCEVEASPSSASKYSNDTCPLKSFIENSICVSSNSSFALSPYKRNSSPSVSSPTTDDFFCTSNLLSFGPSSHEDSLSSFLLSNESSDYAQTFPSSISQRLSNCGGLGSNDSGELDSLDSIDISVFDSLAQSSDLDTMLDLPELNDCTSALGNKLFEEDGSNFLEKYMQGL